jgi:hypothetical protein
MTVRRLIPLGAASCAAAIAMPALAQDAPEMTYEERTYEYATPAPEGEIVYERAEVVQPVAPPHVDHYQSDAHDRVQHGANAHDDVPMQPEWHEAPPPHAMPHSMPHHAYPARAAPLPPQAFDREGWLADCRAQYGDERSRRSGRQGGGILGAAVGGVIGNRVADGDRLAGTLIGAGVGGLAGLAIGSAIGAANDRDRAADECELYLDRYMAGGHAGYPGHVWPGYGYGYHHAYAYPAVAYVPVLVMVPQRAVVRETVTEEWTDAAPKRRRVHHEPAPAPAPNTVKRTKLIKGN